MILLLFVCLAVKLLTVVHLLPYARLVVVVVMVMVVVMLVAVVVMRMVVRVAYIKTH